MSETQKPMNIYQKLAKIGERVDVIKKNRAGYNYKYVSEDIILARIKGLMTKLGVSLIPGVEYGTTKVEPFTYKKTKVLKNGSTIEDTVREVTVQADTHWIWVNNDRPEDRIVVPWTLVGQQEDAAQAFGSGLTYSSRYFLLKYFNVATSEDDPDAWRAIQHEAEEKEKLAITKGILEEVTRIVSAYLDAHPKNRDKVAEVVQKHARDKNNKPSPNYNLITDPDVAKKLLQDIKTALA